MKVLLYDHTCAYLTPGGKTTHALKLYKEIKKLGIDIQFSEWWNQHQQDADIIHFLYADTEIAKQAKERGIKTFFSMIFDFESNKSETEKRIQIIKNRLIDKLPYSVSKSAYWKALPFMDKVQFMHKYDKENAFRYFPKLLNEKKSLIIPHAYDPSDMYISDHLNINDMHFPEKYLISVANISQRKQTLKLAKYAKKAEVPIVFMGGRNVNDPYFQAFEKEIDNKFVFYPGYVSKEWRDCIEQHASGYVLLSLGESGCIAIYEASAYKIPLLLSNLPWAWGYENPTDIYFCDQHNEEKSIQQLKDFYAICGRINHMPFTLHTWTDVAKLYIDEYNKLLSNKL